MKISCDIIKDLLPLYYDGVCSADSKVMIEAHLAQCADCRAELAEMGKELPVSSKEQNLLEAKVVKELSKKWKHSLTKSMMYGALVAFLVNNIAWVYLWFVNNTGNNKDNSTITGYSQAVTPVYFETSTGITWYLPSFGAEQ